MSNKGKKWSSEVSEYKDRRTGVRVRQLTNYRAHTHHLYFTNPGWYDNGRKLIMGSDRDNATNLFGVDLESGEITQLTDLTPLPLPREVEFMRACLNSVRDEAYFWYGYDLVALDLHTLEERTIYTMAEGWDVSMINCSANGKYVYASISEDMSDKFEVDLLRGYVGFRETWAAMPLSQIIEVATDGSSSRVVFEEKYWIGHCNTSPVHNHLLTYCHEGPWLDVDNRIWGLNIETGENWKIRPCDDNEAVGHEYWHADGETVGYHGRHTEKGEFFGHVRYDNTGTIEVPFETIKSGHGHFHSNDINLVVSDIGPTVNVWRWDGEGYGKPRAVCGHDGSFQIQQLHVHPRFNKETSQIVFSGDATGYGNVYIADMPDFESLPLTEDVI